MIVNATNPWGRADGLEPQRSDLWYLEFGQAYDGIMGQLSNNPAIAEQLGYHGDLTWGSYSRSVNPVGGDRQSLRFYAVSINMPDLVVSPEVVKRDSRPYNVPGVDNPLTAIRVGFVHDASNIQIGNEGWRRSEIYSFLNLWRMLVRAGRWPMSSEFSLSLDKNFMVNYGFDVTVNFLGGLDIQQALRQVFSVGPQGLEITSVYTIKNCWLSSFSLGPELAFGEGRNMLINAIFYADDVVAHNVLSPVPTLIL